MTRRGDSRIARENSVVREGRPLPYMDRGYSRKDHNMDRYTREWRATDVPRGTRGIKRLLFHVKHKTERKSCKILSKYLFHVKHLPKKRKIFAKPLENSCKIEKVVLYYG